MDLVIEAILWSTFATILAQVISIGVVAFLGIPPRKLAHEIEEEQNTAVGALFFIIAIITAIYVGVVSGDGYDPSESFFGDMAWILGGAALASVYTWISFVIAHTLMDRVKGESTIGYIRREVITEQNAALSFFLGALAVTPFIATLYQIL